MKIKILQWNILYREKAENILKLLQKVDADVICLQELTTQSSTNPNLDVANYISKKLKLSYYYKEAQNWNLGEETRAIGNGVFSKFPIFEKNYSHTLKSIKNPNSYGKEGRVYVEAQISVNNKKLTVATTHMSFIPHFKTTAMNKKETAKLLEVLSKKKSNFIFTGDLNSLPNSFTIKEISKLLKNAGPSSQQKTFSTRKYDIGNFKVNGLEYRIDYIFTSSDVNVLSAKILNTTYSDHLPILAEIKI